jgi:curved DNA-binding protein CbpA
VTAAKAIGIQATGPHDRETFVRLFFTLYRHQRSGSLQVSFGRKHRTLYLVGGEPVAFASDLPEDALSRTLVNSNLVPAKQMKWVKDKLSEGERLEDALLMSGSIDAEVLSGHKKNRLKVSIGSPLLWGSGEWSFSPAPALQADRIDPKLRPPSECLAAIWNAVVHHVSMDAVFPQVTDPTAGKIELDPICPAIFPAFQVDSALVNVPEILTSGASVDDVFRMVPDSSGNLVKLLWFLEAAGLATRANRTAESDLEVRIDEAIKTMAAKPKKASAKGKQDTAKQATGKDRKQVPSARRRTQDAPTDDQLRAAHRKRMGRDYYAFLGLPPTAAAAGIDRKCKGLARRWRAAQSERVLPSDVQEKVEALLAGVQLVWRILTEPSKRAEYDKRLGQGRAPRVGDLRAATSTLSAGGAAPAQEQTEASERESDHIKARERMTQGDFAGALPFLKKARLDDPSSPDIMADLGHVTWKLKGIKNGDAEEFLRLALTFDAKHPLALETLARISVESDDLELAKKLLQQLVKVAPDPTWARRALGNLGKGNR